MFSSKQKTGNALSQMQGIQNLHTQENDCD